MATDSKMAIKTMDRTVGLKNQMTERRLSKTMENLNTELASSLSTIVRQVRGIQMEHVKGSPETDPSYMRRRQSIDNSNACDNFHLAPDHSRIRSKSFGHSEVKRPKTNGKIKHLSPDREIPVKDGKTIPKPKKTGDRTPMPSSPNDRDFHEQAEFRKSGHRNYRASIDYQNSSPLGLNPAITRNRRMSLPAIMLPTGDLQKELDIRQNSRSGVRRQGSAKLHSNSRETSPEGVGATLQLKRLERDLKQRKPKSCRELKHYNLTTAEEKKELARVSSELSNEFNFGDLDEDYQDKLYRELRNCSYIRRPSNEGNGLSIDDVFK